MASSTTPLQSQLILRPTKFMSPIRVTNGYRYLIQNGKFLTKWIIPEWGGPAGFEDLVDRSENGRLYASSANVNSVLIFDLNGNRVGALTPKPPNQFQGPCGLVFGGPEALCPEYGWELCKRDRSVNT